MAHELRIRVFCGADVAIGPGRAALLEAIAETGSISAAGRQLGISYRKAWLLVDSMNRCHREPLISTQKGGQKGGGAVLTPLGREVAQRYQAMIEQAQQAVSEMLAGYQELLAALPTSEAGDTRPPPPEHHHGERHLANPHRID